MEHSDHIEMLEKMIAFYDEQYERLQRMIVDIELLQNDVGKAKQKVIEKLPPEKRIDLLFKH